MRLQSPSKYALDGRTQTACTGGDGGSGSPVPVRAHRLAVPG